MYKCKCITCKHVRAIKELIPDDELRNKVMKVTNDLFEGMASRIVDLEMELIAMRGKE